MTLIAQEAIIVLLNIQHQNARQELSCRADVKKTGEEMKEKRAAGLFALLAVILMVLALVLVLLCMDAQPVLLKTSKAALERVDAFMTAICDGDYSTAQTMLQGAPDLGADKTPADAAGVLLWKAFVESTEYQRSGDCFIQDSRLAQKVTFNSLDMTSVTASLGDRAKERLARRVSEAEDMSQIYDENNNYREELVMEVLREVTEEAIREDGQQHQQEITLKLVYENGQWWILPEQELLNVLFGGIG